jgi:hypothetical protein
MKDEQEQTETRKPNRIVIWGLRKKWHTHRFIHKAFYENAKKLGYKTIWIEDERKNAKYIEPGDLIISSGMFGKMVPEKFKFEDYNLPIRDDIYYCLHNIKDVFKDKLNPQNYINLQFYNNSVPGIDNIEKWGPATYFDKKSKTLYQPWGTDLLAEEFKKPIFNKNKFVFWIGSVWNDKNNHGNIETINEFKKVLTNNGLKFIKLRFIPNFLNKFFIRKSRIAPAIAGRQQVKVDYLPCRMFKNISYGQLGVTNVKKFKDILGNSFIDGKTIQEITENALSLTKEEYINKIKAQQDIIKKYTYKESLENIFRALGKTNQ